MGLGESFLAYCECASTRVNSGQSSRLAARIGRNSLNNVETLQFSLKCDILRIFKLYICNQQKILSFMRVNSKTAVLSM